MGTFRFTFDPTFHFLSEEPRAPRSGPLQTGA